MWGLSGEAERCWDFGWRKGSEGVLFCCGEMGDFRWVGSEIFADECGGMTIHFYPGIRSFFSEKYPPIP